MKQTGVYDASSQYKNGSFTKFNAMSHRPISVDGVIVLLITQVGEWAGFKNDKVTESYRFSWQCLCWLSPFPFWSAMANVKPLISGLLNLENVTNLCSIEMCPAWKEWFF